MRVFTFKMLFTQGLKYDQPFGAPRSRIDCYSLKPTLLRGRKSKFSTYLTENFFVIDALISQIYSVMKLYMFRAVSLSIIRSLFTVHSSMVCHTIL
jgi:hypothetical protein